MNILKQSSNKKRCPILWDIRSSWKNTIWMNNKKKQIPISDIWRNFKFCDFGIRVEQSCSCPSWVHGSIRDSGGNGLTYKVLVINSIQNQTIPYQYITRRSSNAESWNMKAYNNNILPLPFQMWKFILMPWERRESTIYIQNNNNKYLDLVH